MRMLSGAGQPSPPSSGVLQPPLGLPLVLLLGLLLALLVLLVVLRALAYAYPEIEVRPGTCSP